MSAPNLKRLLEPYKSRIGGIIQGLRAIMQHRGWIEPESITLVAEIFNKSVAEIKGVVGFYSDFKTSPPKPNLIRICKAESCQSLGSRKLLEELNASGVLNETDVETEDVFCLGLCPLGPALEVNGNPIACATPDQVRAMIR